LGDTSYVVGYDGVGLVVDPQRDLDRFEAELDRTGAALKLVLETHLHNDYVSGGRHLAGNHGADLVLPAASGAAFPHTPAFHHEELTVGALTIRPIHTPGHTPEHTSYLLIIDDAEVAVFSGGSLLVSSAGRTDLLGTDRAEQLARLQYQSVNRLAGLGDDVHLLPTHGAGSFCTAAAPGLRAVSTIGLERRNNPVLQHADADAFVADALHGLEPYPTYYAHIGPINAEGPAPEPDYDLPVLAVDDIPEGAYVVDIRSKADFAAGHLAGSLGIPASVETGVWTGWLVPFGAPVVLVTDSDEAAAAVATRLARIGYDDVRGVIHDLADAETASYRAVGVDEVTAALDKGIQLVDVRSPGEWEIAHIEGSTHRYVPDITANTFDLDRSREVWLVCVSGYRATIAAALFEAEGFTPVVLSEGGVPNVMRTRAAQSA
jgi:glyoxylase-like metal-dependent hydrolase (beta-lactamase superfamily II)/rhodanese-related sulfurtransferase